MNSKTIFFIIAGEQSADNHGAELIKSIQKLNSNIHFVGIGGKEMIKNGLKSMEKIDKLAIMGFIEIIRHFPFFMKLTKRIISKIIETQPKQIILIDYPGFNLHIAKKIKKRFNIPITYYISPQIWAWKENRIKIIKKYIDQMLVIFPFEKKWYKNRGLQVEFVGHPLLDVWKPSPYKQLRSLIKVNFSNPIITLYPGSRKQELIRHLPLLISISKILRKRIPNVQFIIGLAKKMKKNKYNIPKWIQIEDTYPQKALECANLALVASGTATLEAAVFNTPMIIIYKMSILSWFLTKILIKTNYAGMVNIIAEKKIMSEYLQYEANTKIIANEAFEIISNTDLQKKMKLDLLNVRNKLGGPGASIKAAKKILSLSNIK